MIEVDNNELIFDPISLVHNLGIDWLYQGNLEYIEEKDKEKYRMVYYKYVGWCIFYLC